MVTEKKSYINNSQQKMTHYINIVHFRVKYDLKLCRCYTQTYQHFLNLCILPFSTNCTLISSLSFSQSNVNIISSMKTIQLSQEEKELIIDLNA